MIMTAREKETEVMMKKTGAVQKGHVLVRHVATVQDLEAAIEDDPTDPAPVQLEDIVVVGATIIREMYLEQPEPSRCLGIFGMSLYTTEHELHHVLSKYGPLEKVQVVKDAKTGRSRGFAFVYYESLEDAKAAKEGCNGIELDGRRIRCDYSITQRAHTPTPGIYMGNPTYSERNRRRSPGYGRRRSPYRRSPYRRSPSYDRDRRRRRDYRSRSRSYSR
ncbi:hypothetical protein QYM36_013575, partial [Artemia franciscana]